MTQLAVAWIIKNPDVSTCLLGCTDVSQLDDIIKGFEIYRKLDNDIGLEIEKILKNSPQGEIDYRYFKEMKIRRNELLGIDYIREKKNN